MAQTPKLLMTLIEVGQKEKEAAINNALLKIDTAMASVLDNKYLGEMTTDPSGTFLAGTLYFNTTTNKLKVLKTSMVWSNVA